MKLQHYALEHVVLGVSFSPIYPSMEIVCINPVKKMAKQLPFGVCIHPRRGVFEHLSTYCCSCILLGMYIPPSTSCSIMRLHMLYSLIESNTRLSSIIPAYGNGGKSMY